MKNFTAYIERDEDGLYVGSVPALPGCYTQGATLQELVDNLKEVVTLCARNHEEYGATQFVGLQTIEVVV